MLAEQKRDWSTSVSTIVNAFPSQTFASWAEEKDPFLFRRARTWWLLLALFLMADSAGLFNTQGIHPGALIGERGGATLDQSTESVALISNGVWVICIGLMFGHLKSIVRQMIRQKVVLSFLVLAFLSTLWSQSPTMTIRKSVMLTLYLFFAWYFSTHYTPADQMRLLIMLGVIMGLGSVVWALVLPKYGIQGTGEWKGIFGQKNMLGTAMLSLFSALPFRPITNFRQLGSVCLQAILPIGLIIMSDSKTSLLMAMLLVAARILGPMIIRMKKEAMPLLVYGLGLVLIMIPISLGVIVTLLGRDLTFSDRTVYWGLLFPYALKHMWLGYGYQAFFVSRAGEFSSIPGPTYFKDLVSADNGYLDIMLQCGLAGVATLFVLLGKSISDMFAIARRSFVPLASFWYASLILAICLGGLTDNIFWKPIRMVPFVLAVACAGLGNLKDSDASLPRTEDALDG